MTTIGSALIEQTTVINALIYGAEGTGKSTAAARLSQLGRTLIIDAEGGVKREALTQRGVNPDNIEIWPPDNNPSAITYNALSDVADQLRDQTHNYTGVVLDSYTEISRRLLDETVTTARTKDQRLGKERGQFQINLEDYGVASSMLRDLLRRFRDLPIHLFITALERRDLDDDGKVRYGPALSPAVATDVLGLVDIVGYTVVEQINNEQIYSAHFRPVTRRRAKDRFGLLPEKMVDPYADRITAYITGTLTPETDPARAHVLNLIRQTTNTKEHNNAETR